jgi:hypothetical protein
MVSLHLPVRHLLQDTRLRHSLKSGELWRCSICQIGIHDAEWMARHLASNHATHQADCADSILIVEDYYNHRRECLKYQ